MQTNFVNPLSSFVEMAMKIPGVVQAARKILDFNQVRDGGESDDDEVDLRELLVDQTGVFTGDLETLVVVTPDHVIVGEMLTDEDVQSPMKYPGQGVIYHGSNARERADYFEALGLDSSGEMKMGDFDDRAIEIAVDECSKAGRLMAMLALQLRNSGAPHGRDDVIKGLKRVFSSTSLLDGAANAFFSCRNWSEVPDGAKEGLAARLLMAYIEEFEAQSFHKAAFDEAARERSVGDAMAVVLDIYRHGGTQYSLSGEGMQCQWDTSRREAVWVPDVFAKHEILVSAFKDHPVVRVKNEAICFVFSVDAGGTFHGFGKSMSAAQAIMEASKAAAIDLNDLWKPVLEATREYVDGVVDAYNDWVNGDCYQYSVYVVDRRTLKVEERECVGGYIGSQHAEETMRDSVLDMARELLAEQAQPA